MQNRNWHFLNRVVTVAAVTLLVGSGTTLGVAQLSAGSVAMFAAAPKEATNIPGVYIFADRPKGFNPLTANSQELGRYGLPPRPDQQSDPKGYAKWTRAMQAVKYRPSAVLTAKSYTSQNLIMAQPRAGASVTAATGPTSYSSYNWSGVANTNKLKTWNAKTSFKYVQSLWNVPAAQPPFGACESGITGPFIELTWNGIDGVSSGDVLQGGSASYADCGGPSDNAYFGYVEWYPSYPVLAIDAPVDAGDDFLVQTNGAFSGSQFVYVEDITKNWAGTYELDYVTGPLLVGSSAEQIISRPSFQCEGGSCLYALANYIEDFFADSTALNGKNIFFNPGEQVAATAIFTMVDDGNTTDASQVAGQGSHGIQGLKSLWFQDEGCAYVGGCTPVVPFTP